MYKNKFHNDFELNGNSFSSVSELIDYAKYSIKLQKFLQEWFSVEDYVVVKTSGSTGKPKPIQLKKEFMINSAKATGNFFDLKPKTKALCCLPVDFIAGKMMVVRALALGWHLDVVEPNSNPLKDTEEEYDFSAMVPLQVQNSIEKLHFIKTLIIGGGEVKLSLINQLQNTSIKAYATYGMTETITHVAVQKLNHYKTQVETLDKVEVKSRNLYKALPDVTFTQDKRDCLVIKASKISNVTIVTNDVVDLVSEKEFTWKGRFDNTINSAGIKLYPEEIEKKLASAIYQRFFVAGIPDETLGEKLVLIVEDIILSEDIEFSRNEVERSLKQEISSLKSINKYETPKEIFFTDNFLETETGKIKRKETLQTILP